MIRETRTRQRGQSIVVALLVLLLLGLAGALFVTIVARNLLNARHANRVLTADQYARAGITFADAQLANSLDGADWRPPLQYQLAVLPTEKRELDRYTVASANLPSLTTPPYRDDPDRKYLEAGFARYNTGAGRFLLRLTYTPVLEKDSQGQFFDPVYGLDANNVAIAPVSVPPGKYIKIESIGREGVIDSLDPTTYGNNRTSDRLQSYQVAFQPIGITDYARFETNPDNRSTTADMGVTSRFYAQDTDGGIASPGAYDFVPNNGTYALDPITNKPVLSQYSILTTYGAPDAYFYSGGVLVPNPTAGSASTINTTKALPGGGSFHANMPVRFFGKNIAYLNDAGTDAPLYQDSMEVVGDLLLNGYTQTQPLFTTSAAATTGQRASLEINPTDLTKLTAAPAPVLAPTMNLFVVPSNDTGGAGSNGGFSTRNGLVRDGSSQTDINGLPRSIQRIEPPLMNAVESATQLPRYKAIAMNAPPRGNLKKTDGTAYTPPTGDFTPSRYGYGRNIYIDNTQDVQPESTSIGGGSTLVDEWLNRTESGSDPSKGNWNGNFYDPPGVSIILGQTIKPAGPSNTPPAVFGIRLVRGAGTPGFVGPDGQGSAGPVMDIAYSDLDSDAAGIKSDNDIVIYAEGNVRVHGILSPNEGSANSPQFVPRHITIVTNGTAYIEGNVLKGSADSSISILAHDYVCVNTSQFLAGPSIADSTNGFQTATPKNIGGLPYLDITDGVTLLQEFNFGLTGADTPAAQTPSSQYGTRNLALYVSATSGDTGSALANFDILDISGTSVLAPTTTPPSPPIAQSFTGLTQLTLDLSGNPKLMGAVGTDLFRLSVARSQGTDGDSTRQNVELGRVAILPMDIRVEAVLYAQTRSFFVIPGDWFNTRSDDTLDKYTNGLARPDQLFTPGPGLTTIQAQQQNDRARFPFYGQPIDMKIIIDGSVSEAQPSDVANQTAWMLKWGWIPQFHGSAASTPTPGATTAEPSGHQLVAGNAPANKPAIGLQIIYNPQAGYPYNPGGGTTAKPGYYLRSDAYGRPLPFTPKLPVSTALLFAGQSSEPPLLQ